MICRDCWRCSLAGLREESAEPLIRLGGLALLGEVSIWL